MDFRRTRPTLTTFAVSAILTSVLLPAASAQAIGLPESSSAKVVQVAASAPAPNPDRFTAAEIAVLMKFDTQHIRPAQFSRHFGKILGLTNGSQTLTVYEMNQDFPKDPSEAGIEHFFTPLPDGAYLFFRREENSSGTVLFRDFFILNHDRSLRAAYRVLPPNRVAQRLSPWEAKTRLAIEIHAWRNGIAGKDYNN